MDLILARFREFNPLVVAAAGLIDGINPCAFTTLTLFISYLTLARYPRRETALVGTSFILSMLFKPSSISARVSIPGGHGGVGGASRVKITNIKAVNTAIPP